MACNGCESGFEYYQSIIVSIQKSGSKALLYVENQGKNIVMIRRILLCYVTTSGGVGTLYLRPPPEGIAWDVRSAFLEAGSGALYYTLSGVKNLKLVQAEAEYIEVEGRSRSCAIDF